MIGIFKVLLWKYGSFFFPFQKDRCKYTVAPLFKVPSIEDRIYKCCSTSELLITTLINWSLLENHITKKTFISAGYQHKWLKVGQSMLQKQVTSSESSDPQTHTKKKASSNTSAFPHSIINTVVCSWYTAGGCPRSRMSCSHTWSVIKAYWSQTATSVTSRSSLQELLQLLLQQLWPRACTLV